MELGVRPCLQYGVVLPCVLGVVALQQAAAHGGARTCKLRHVEVGEAQLRGREQQREVTFYPFPILISAA